jgi:hypothetical protein
MSQAGAFALKCASIPTKRTKNTKACYGKSWRESLWKLGPSDRFLNEFQCAVVQTRLEATGCLNFVFFVYFVVQNPGPRRLAFLRRCA